LKQYQRIKQALIRGIAGGRWQPGDRVPSENELASEHGTSRMTARRALTELEAEGVIRRIQGLGSFVARRTIGTTLHQIRDISEDIAARGCRHRHKILLQTIAEPPPNLSEWLGNDLPETVGHLRLVHLADSLPIQYESRWVSLSLLPDFQHIDWATTPPSRVLLQRIPLSRALQRISAVALPEQAAASLQMARGSPGLFLQRVTWSGSEWATYSHFYHPGNAFSLESNIETEVLP
jgi:GntR family histidine utilization transcriptional repressor